MQPLLGDGCVCGHRHGAATAQPAEKRAFRRDRRTRHRVVKRRQQGAHGCLIAALHGQRALSRRRQHEVERQHFRDGVAACQPFDARRRQQDRVVGTVRVERLANARIDVAANVGGAQVRVGVQQLCGAAPAARADDGAGRQRCQRPAAAADHDIVYVGAHRNGADHDARRQFGRQILEAMHGQIDGATVQRGLQFGGEETFAADQWQRLVEDAVALRVQHFHLDNNSRPRGAQLCGDVIRLPACQRRPARAEAQRGNMFSHGRRLHWCSLLSACRSPAARRGRAASRWQRRRQL